MRISVYDYELNKKVILKSNTNEYIDGEVYNERFVEDVNGESELTMILPLTYTIDGVEEDNHRWAFIIGEYKIRLEEDGEPDRWFKIKSTNDINSDGILKSNIQCKSISYDLNKKNTELIPNKTDTASNLVTYALQSTGWTTGTIDSFSGKTLTLKSTTSSNALGMLNDIASLFDGRLEFNTSEKKVNLYSNDSNTDTQIEFRAGKNIRSLQRSVTSDNIITRLYITGGEIDTGTVGIQSVNPTKEPYADNFSYYIENGMMSSYKQSLIPTYNSEILAKNQEISVIQSDINSLKNNTSGNLVIKNTTTYLRDSKVERVDEIDAKLEIETDPTIISTLSSEKSILLTEISDLNCTISSLESLLNDYDLQLQQAETDYDLVVSEKDAIKNAFYSEMSDYIHEGVYNNSSLIDPQSIYDEGISILEDRCYPQLSYSLKIADLSSLDGYELEKIRLGNIISVYDPFLKIKTKLTITKIDKDLASPINTEIAIENYYDNIDELFKQITKNSEIIKQQQNYWDRTSLTVNPDGTLNPDRIQATFDFGIYKITSGQNSSIEQSEEGIILHDLSDENNLIRMNGSKIETSKNGGTSWTTVVNQNGASVSNLFGGVLDVTEVYLKGDTNFFWNGEGFYAIDSSNPSKWIRFNEEGLIATFDNGVTTEFSLTWAGLSIGKSSVEGLEDELNDLVHLGEAYNNVTITTARGLVATHSDGSETIVDGDGLKRKIISNNNVYNYISLFEVGSGVSPGEIMANGVTQANLQPYLDDAYLDSQNLGIMWVTLANPDFQGRTFEVVPSYSGIDDYQSYMADGKRNTENIDIDILEYDYPNGRFKIRARRTNWFQRTFDEYWWSGKGCKFSYNVFATS